MAAIGFIGLGNMGGPMAANLVKAGHKVRGFDLVPALLEAAKQTGVEAADSAESAARAVDAIITMLPAGGDVTKLYREALVPAARADSLFIDCSTIDVAAAREAHEFAAKGGMAAIDAPVSGGVGGAVAGTLTFMVGGEELAYVRSRPILEAMGKKLVHCGGAGAGQAAKICNNMILGITMIGVSEAFVLAEKLGLSHRALFEVASTASGQCWALTSYCPVPGPVPNSPANHAYKPGFSAALMLKDLRLARAAADASGADTALGRHAADIYGAFDREGFANQDFSAIINAIRDRSSSA